MDLSKTLISLSPDAAGNWTIDDAMKGISIIGGTGSGKTTASGKRIATAFLEEGWGGIVLCAKSDEAALWEEYCRKAGREKDLIMFRKGSKHKRGAHKGQDFIFNPIDYEMKREGIGAGETQNITNIFMNIHRMGNRIAGESDKGEDRFWDTSLKRCLNRTIELLKLSGKALSYSNMAAIISSSATIDTKFLTDGRASIERGEYVPDDGDANFCETCLLQAYYRECKRIHGTPDEESSEYKLVEEYFTRSMPALGEKTRSIIVESFMGLAEPFLSGLFATHFAGKTNIFPELTYTKQKIIVLDFSIKEFLDAGIIAQSLFKLMFQQAMERRDTGKFPKPVFLWADEAHYFINDYDQAFLTTARSSRTATVFLSQNISNYLAVMGNKPRVDSLMGNLSTKIFHANSDAATNTYASELIGQDLDYQGNAGISQASDNIAYTSSANKTGHYLPQVQPREFTTLRSGGTLNDFKVDAIIMVSGRKSSKGKNYFEVCFKQEFS